MKQRKDTYILILHVIVMGITFIATLIYRNKATGGLIPLRLNRNREPRDHIAREQEGDQIDRMNTADVVQCPDLVYIRRRVRQTADVPAGHHQPWLTTPCMELRSRDYRVFRPEARSADHLEAKPNFTSRTMYDFRMQKGYRAMPIRIDQTVDKDIPWHMSSTVTDDGLFYMSEKYRKFLINLKIKYYKMYFYDN